MLLGEDDELPPLHGARRFCEECGLIDDHAADCPAPRTKQDNGAAPKMDNDAAAKVDNTGLVRGLAARVLRALAERLERNG
jgi:hypothetical protein